MIAVNLDGVSVTYIHEPIFEALSWEIHDDKVVGLVGPNGCGKSTALKLIAGELNSESGFLNRKKGLTIGYLHQEPKLEPDKTVMQLALSASQALAAVERDLRRVEASLADPEVYGNEKRLNRAVERQGRLLDQFVELGGPGYEGHVRSIVMSLGFKEQDFELPVEALSGGQKKLIGLAQLLITGPDLLLLDEPDNHLDLEGKRFLEKFIHSYRGAVVIVSHDRYLLDLVVDEIAELEDGRLTRYPGNYSEYAFEKQAALLRQQQMFEAQQKEIQRLEQSAARLLMWGRVYDNEKFSKRGQSMMKRLEKIERLDRPVLERRRMGLKLSGWRGSQKVLEVLGLEKSFPSEAGGDDHIILAGIDLLIRRGERVGLIGPNGAGKSVLFRLLLDELAADKGEIKIGPSITTAYYAQQHETLDPNRTLIETVTYTAEWPDERAVAFLSRFLFDYEQSRGRIGNLSGGERSRLQMALMVLSGANFLLLDEPTNNLDIPSAEVLESALEEFEGSVLVISHDRYFLDRVVERIIELDQGKITEYLGSYSDYEGQKRGQQIP
jgi:ATP-binding cassette subfamily F protein 3